MNSKDWKDLAKLKKACNPECEECLKAGRVSPSQCVHHVTEIESGRTDKECWELATSWNNLQALCFKCHGEIHKAKRSHSKVAHKQRNSERLLQFANRHGRKT